MSKCTKPDLQKILTSSLDAAAKGRSILLDYYGRLESVREKDRAGLVTDADIESEGAIIGHLKAHYPQFSYLGEESGAYQGDKDARFIIDPLDGTTNYVHNFPFFMISIGFEYEGEMLVGVLDAPIFNQTFSCIKGKGAFLNGQPIKVSERSTMAEGLFTTGFLTQDSDILNKQLNIFPKFLGKTRGLRRTGSACYDLCMVASGKFDAFWESYLKPWDVAAGSLLVTEAGGRVTDFSGDNFSVGGMEIFASNSLIHDQCLDTFSQN